MSWLRDVADRTPKPEPKSHNFGVHQGGGNGLQRVRDFISRHQIQAKGPTAYKKDVQKWQIDCPFNPGHKSPDAIITLADSGAIGFKCSHDSCADKRSWKQLREHFGESGTEVVQQELQRPRVGEFPALRHAVKATRYLLNPELPEGCIVALVGPSGCGKSTLAAAWAREAIALDRSVLILDRENPQDVVVDRADRVGLADGPLLQYAGGWLGEVPEPDDKDLIEWIMRNEQGSLVVVDSMIAFLGGDENSATDMRRFMDKLRALSNLGATVLVIHHDGKATTAKDYRGSSDFKGSLDQAFHVTNSVPDGRLDRLTLRCFKSRYGLVGSLYYVYEEGKFRRADSRIAKAQSEADTLRELLRQVQPVSKTKFVEQAISAGVPRDTARGFIDSGLTEGTVIAYPGERGGKLYSLSDGMISGGDTFEF
jgi:KaiC/GvpD/RAD55 family RecA-like ATPase